MDLSATNGKTIRLSIPAQEGWIVVARLAASGIVTELGWDVEQIDDMKVALTESCLWLFESLPKDAPAEVWFAFTCRDDALDAEIRLQAQTEECVPVPQPEKLEVRKSIIETMVHTAQFTTDRVVLSLHRA